MNLILLHRHDFIDTQRVLLKGRRFQHIAQILQAQPGDALRVGLINANTGYAQLQEYLDDGVILALGDLDQAAPPALPLTVILALPRPRVLQRTLQTLTTLGVARICLLQTARVEKSFWQTPLLAPNQIDEQLQLGLEQARATQWPVVECHTRFRPFVEDRLPDYTLGAQCYVAHPGRYPLAGPVDRAPATILAVGPEGGFLEKEVQSFVAAGFQPIQLGERILKVETALPVLLAKMF